VDVRDLVFPLFACPGDGVERPLEGLEGIAQRSVDRLCDEAEEVLGLGVGAVLLFGIPEERTRRLPAPTMRTASCSKLCAPCGSACPSSSS
jgi:delta-aminolevulinic acid dehydratase/porphobilinogen synthase